MKSNSISSLGRRHAALAAAGAQERLYDITLVVRIWALDEQEASETVDAMVDGYNIYRAAITDDADDADAAAGAAVVVRSVTIAVVEAQEAELAHQHDDDSSTL